MRVVKVCVVGAGVIGLSTAVQLTELRIPETELRVTLVAEEFSPNTTSDGAGGIWDPTLCGVYTKDCPPNVEKWSAVTFAHSTALARSRDAGEAGAVMVTGNSYFSKELTDKLYWKDIVLNFKRLTEKDFAKLPHCGEMGLMDGYVHQTVVVDCLKYLPWLLTRFLKNGGSVQQRKLSSLNELAGKYAVVVNCTGIGARDLVKDTDMYSLKGQLVRMHAPWIRHFTIINNRHVDNAHDLLYIIPKASHVVLGGTYVHHNYDKTPDLEQRKRILRGCLKLEPALEGAKFLGDWTGLRPFRSEIRLEREVLDAEGGKLHVVHNYGHKGTGITLHWGCGAEACELVQQCIVETSSKL